MVMVMVMGILLSSKHLNREEKSLTFSLTPCSLKMKSTVLSSISEPNRLFINRRKKIKLNLLPITFISTRPFIFVLLGLKFEPYLYKSSFDLLFKNLAEGCLTP